MKARAPIALLTLAFAACGDRTLVEPTVLPFAPSFEIATERLVVEGPFSLRDRVGADFTPFDLNDRGDIVGLSVPLGGFGILPGDGGPLLIAPLVISDGGANQLTVTALNELGVAAGSVSEVPLGGSARTRLMLWSPGSDPEPGPYVPGVTAADAALVSVHDVNDLGTIVGQYGDDFVPQFPFRWTPGTAAIEMLDLSNGGDGAAAAINSAGVAVGIVGGSALPVPGANGAIWAANGDLTIISDADDFRDINEGGQIAGRQRGFCPSLWDADLSILWEAPCGPTFEVIGLAVNDMGHFLYRGATESDPTIGNRLRIEGFEPVTLPPLPGADLTGALRLNNTGTILGNAFAAGLTSPEAVIWTYRFEPASPSEVLNNLADVIDDLAADGTLGPSAALALGTKIDAANHQLAHGHCAAAVSLLETVIRLVDAAERTGQLSAEQAAGLRDAVNAAIAGIEATCEEA